MRALRPASFNRKQKPSKFFEYFLNQYGPSCTSRASVKEIHDKIKTLYLDLAFGNMQQPKYYQYIIGDNRIIECALNDLTIKFSEAVAYRDALRYTASAKDPSVMPILSNPSFNKCLNDSENRVYSYSILIEGLTEFKNSGIAQDGFIHLEMANIQFLIKIPVQLNNNPFARGAKQQLLL